MAWMSKASPSAALESAVIKAFCRLLVYTSSSLLPQPPPPTSYVHLAGSGALFTGPLNSSLHTSTEGANRDSNSSTRGLDVEIGCRRHGRATVRRKLHQFPSIWMLLCGRLWRFRQFPMYAGPPF